MANNNFIQVSPVKVNGVVVHPDSRNYITVNFLSPAVSYKYLILNGIVYILVSPAEDCFIYRSSKVSFNQFINDSTSSYFNYVFGYVEF